MKSAMIWRILVCLIVIGMVLAGCSQVGVISGSGNTITRQYDFSNFTDVEVTNAFTIEVTPSNTYTVSITTNENLFDYFLVSKSGNTLKIGMKSGTSTNANPKVKVTLPVLNRLSLSGATRGSAKDFVSSQNFKLELSGASTLDLGMETGNTDITISGASRATGQLKTLDSRMEISGASRAELTGSANNLNLNVSGASTANLPNFSLQNASTEISGASTANLNVNGKLNVDVSGASNLNYTGNPNLGTISVTGASSLNHK